jgi:Rod binding domain-containing protein
MGGIPEYRGLANNDIRPLRNTPSSAGQSSGKNGSMVFSVEDFRKGINFKSSDAVGGTSSKGNTDNNASPNAQNSQNAQNAYGTSALSDTSNSSNPSDASDANNTTDNSKSTSLSSYRKKGGYVPKSYLRAHSGGNMTEEQRIQKLQKIRESAKEYEGVLMAEMIKSMRQQPLTKTAGSETLTEIAEKPFTAALTAAGGLGLADKIVEDVAAQEGLSGTLNDHPEIMGPNWKMRIAPSRRFKQSGIQNVALDSNAPSLRKAPNIKQNTANEDLMVYLGNNRNDNMENNPDNNLKSNPDNNTVVSKQEAYINAKTDASSLKKTASLDPNLYADIFSNTNIATQDLQAKNSNFSSTNAKAQSPVFGNDESNTKGNMVDEAKNSVTGSLYDGFY